MADLMSERTEKVRERERETTREPRTRAERDRVAVGTVRVVERTRASERQALQSRNLKSQKKQHGVTYLYPEIRTRSSDPRPRAHTAKFGPPHHPRHLVFGFALSHPT